MTDCHCIPTSTIKWLDFEYIVEGQTLDKHPIIVASAVIFVTVWTVGMSSSIASARCLDGRREAQERVFPCNLAASTSFARFSKEDIAELVRIEFELGVVLSETGQNEEAITTMRAAIERARLDLEVRDGKGDNPNNIAKLVILERAQRLELNSIAFATFARLQSQN